LKLILNKAGQDFTGARRGTLTSAAWSSTTSWTAALMAHCSD
jgi:hypothetical protein